MSQICLGTCRWINKALNSTGIYSCSMRDTNITEVEGWWPLSNWPNHLVPETQTTAPRLLHAFLLYPISGCTSRMTSESSALPFKWEKHCACAGELPGFACTCTSIPTYYFLLLHKNPVIFSITKILSLWHSPPGISVHPCTGASNLLLK